MNDAKEIVEKLRLHNLNRLKSLGRGMWGTWRQRKAALVYTATGNQTEAYKCGGMTRKEFQVLMVKPEFQEDCRVARKRLENDLEAAGITPRFISTTLADAMNASQVLLDKNGEEHKVPDFKTRLAAADKVMKVRGDYAPTEIHTKGVHVQLDSETLKMIEKIQGRLEGRE